MKTKSANLLLFPLLLVFYEISVYLSNDAYAPALPLIKQQFMTSDHWVQMTFTCWFLGSLSLQLIIGPISERYGRRSVLLLGGILYVVGTIACAMATNIYWLLAARVVQGAAVPTMSVVGYAAVHELLERNAAIQALARMQSITILAPAFGPLLGSLMLVYVNWHWTFVLLAVWASLALVLLFLHMPETLPVEQRTTTISLKTVLSQYYQIIMNFGFMKNIVSACCLISGLIGWMLAAPFLVTEKFRYSIIYYGLFQVLVFSSFVAGMTIVKRKLDDDNINWFVRTGLSCGLCGAIVTLIVAYSFSHSIVAFILSLMILSLGGGLCFPILNRLAIEASDAPMGLRMSMVTLTMIGMATINTLSLSLIYNGSLSSLAWYILIYSVIAFVLICSPKTSAKAN